MAEEERRVTFRSFLKSAYKCNKITYNDDMVKITFVAKDGATYAGQVPFNAQLRADARRLNNDRKQFHRAVFVDYENQQRFLSKTKPFSALEALLTNKSVSGTGPEAFYLVEEDWFDFT
jgi:hypothetical protein